MHNYLDLSAVRKKQIMPLNEKFRGVDPQGKELGLTNYYMTLDGEPFFGITGEIHYSRVAEDQWEDSIIKAKLCGLNVIATYIFWIVHEETHGVFRFDGNRNLRKFIELCAKHGLYVILRIGPFDHGEMRNGGLPDWLYGMPFTVRDGSDGYYACVRELYRAINEQVDGLYYRQGGPIIAAQIENEYMHSSAQWEITTGISDEWINPGTERDSHMLRLKEIAREEGIVTPFYTCTAWGGAITPVDEMLPLWGGYSYWPWIFYKHGGKHPLTPEYIYRDNHNNSVPSSYNFEPCYPPESMPYSCCEMMGGMVNCYNYRFTLPFESVDAMANIKLGSGCNLLGYYMYRGGTNPRGEKTPFLNEAQVPKLSYDYQAVIGEYGQLRPSWYRLRALHTFCHSFRELLCGAVTVLPENQKDMKPEDFSALRWCVRLNGESGFVFLNNFQDHAELPRRKGESITLQLPEENLTLEDLSLESGENAILPVNLPIGGAKLKWASAQPLTVWEREGETLAFFFTPAGMKARYVLDAEGIERVEGCDPVRQGKTLICIPEQGCLSELRLCVNGKTLRIVTLTREQSQQFTLLETGGKKTAFLSDGCLFWNGRELRLELDKPEARALSYPPLSLETPSDCESEKISACLFKGLAIKRKKTTVPVAYQDMGRGRYQLRVPVELLSGHKTVLLQLKYTGDVGYAFIDGEMIADNFCNGTPWPIRMDSWKTELADNPLTVYIAPIREGANVNVDSAMAARMETVGKTIACLESAELVWIDEVSLL